MAAPGPHAALPGLLRPGRPGKRARLATLVARYRNQIERDLRGTYGLRLQELWRERRWRELLNLIDGLGANSWTQDAIANDDEYAQAAIKANGGKPPEGSKNPPLREWDQTASLLASVVEEQRLTNLLLRKAHFKGGDDAKVTPVARPKTAIQRIAAEIDHERRLRRHDELVRKLLGDRAKKEAQ